MNGGGNTPFTPVPLPLPVDATVRAQEVAQAGGIDVPINFIPISSPPKILDPVIPQKENRFPLHHFLWLTFAGLVVWWILSGDDPITTVKKAAEEVKEVVT